MSAINKFLKQMVEEVVGEYIVIKTVYPVGSSITIQYYLCKEGSNVPGSWVQDPAKATAHLSLFAFLFCDTANTNPDKMSNVKYTYILKSKLVCSQ